MKAKRARKKKIHLIVKVLIAPFRALYKVTDLYVKAVMDCQGSVAGYGMAVNSHVQLFTVAIPPPTTPASSSTRSENKMVNNGNMGRKRRRDNVKEDEIMFQLIQKSSSSNYSFEIGKIGMIDEERSCSFRIDDTF
ncbi:hypothetical protein LINPERPRIM_LOCUS18769 [Linum perenne]